MTKTKLKEWQKHILSPIPYTTECGEAVQFYFWCFTDAQHAMSTVAHSERLQPCPDCWMSLIDTEGTEEDSDE